MQLAGSILCKKFSKSSCEKNVSHSSAERRGFFPGSLVFFYTGFSCCEPALVAKLMKTKTEKKMPRDDKLASSR